MPGSVVLRRDLRLVPAIRRTRVRSGSASWREASVACDPRGVAHPVPVGRPPAPPAAGPVDPVRGRVWRRIGVSPRWLVHARSVEQAGRGGRHPVSAPIRERRPDTFCRHIEPDAGRHPVSTATPRRPRPASSHWPTWPSHRTGSRSSTTTGSNRCPPTSPRGRRQASVVHDVRHAPGPSRPSSTGCSTTATRRSCRATSRPTGTTARRCRPTR